MVKGVRAMVMWRLKACPRCGGDMFIGKDDKWFQQCIQCSCRAELKMLDKFEKEPVKAKVQATTKG
jgi:hypothetical protein